MKGIIGVDAGYLRPGDLVQAQNGYRLSIVRKVDLAAARDLADSLGDTAFQPADGEHFYEVEVVQFADVSEN